MRIAILSLSVVLAFCAGYLIKPDTVVIEKAPTELNVGGQVITLGDGDSLEYIVSENNSTEAAVNKYEGNASAKGSKYSFWGFDGGIMGKSLMTHNSGPAEISVGGAAGTLAAAAYSASLSVNNGPLLIVIFGSICVIGGIVCWVKGWGGSIGMWVVIGGAALIVVGLTFGSFPWIGLILIPLAIAGLIYFWFRAKTGEDKTVTLRTIVGGVEKLTDNIKNEVKSAISTEAKANGTGTNGVKPVVSKVVAEVKKDII